MAHPDTFTLELPTAQMGAAQMYPPRLAPGDRHDADLATSHHRLFPLLSKPKRHRKTWRPL